MKIYKSKGFTLIEVLIAVSLISIIALSFMMFSNSRTKVNSKNEHDIHGLNIAQSEMESLREQIKENKLGIKITTDNNSEINIPSSQNDFKTQYTRKNKSIGYIVDLEINKVTVGSKVLHKIKITTYCDNDDLSRRKTNLYAEILSK